MTSSYRGRRGGAMVRALDLRSAGREFDPRPGRGCGTTPGNLVTLEISGIPNLEWESNGNGNGSFEWEGAGMNVDGT